MKYFSLNVGDLEIKLRITARYHAELDKLMGGKFLKIMQDNDTLLNAMDVAEKLIYIGAKGIEQDNKVEYTHAACEQIIDELVDEGWSTEDFIKLIVNVGEVSGFLPQGANDKAAELAKAELAKAEDESRA